MDHKGRLIVIEGIDGTGKTTIACAIQEYLIKHGYDAILTFEPTNGRYGKMIRESFTARERLSAEEENRLFLEDRKEHVRDLILPALKEDKIVVCDRYYFSTMAYQGARGMDIDKIRKENECFAPRPDIVFLLELDPEIALKRICEKRKTKPNNFEGLDYLKKVDAIFRSFNDPFIVREQADRPKDEIISDVWGKTAAYLGVHLF